MGYIQNLNQEHIPPHRLLEGKITMVAPEAIVESISGCLYLRVYPLRHTIQNDGQIRQIGSQFYWWIDNKIQVEIVMFDVYSFWKALVKNIN
jgi:hypothetical protein